MNSTTPQLRGSVAKQLSLSAVCTENKSRRSYSKSNFNYAPDCQSEFADVSPVGTVQTALIEFSKIPITLAHVRTGLFCFDYGNRRDIYPSEFDYLRSCFKQWVDSPLYISFFNPDIQRFEFHKAMKRGNSVYAYKLRKRIDSACEFFDKSTKFLVRQHNRKFISNTLFITLTWDTKLYNSNRYLAWVNVTKEYNNFITKFRQMYGDCWVFRTLEATAQGYPHIHLLIVSKNSFEVFMHKEEYRVKNKNRIASLWPSYVDVKAPYNVKSMRNYLTKDLFKQIYMNTPQDTLSLSLNWLFRKRSYAISKGRFIAEFIDGLSLFQMSLDDQIKEESSKGLLFCGFVVINAYYGTPPPDKFTRKLTESEFKSLFDTIVRPSNDFFNLALERGYTVREVDNKKGFYYG